MTFPVGAFGIHRKQNVHNLVLGQEWLCIRHYVKVSLTLENVNALCTECDCVY